jgi:hypothetical protein
MCEGQHRRYWATGLPGWMRGGGRGGPGWGHRSHGPWHEHGHGHGECGCAPDLAEPGRCECGRWRDEPTGEGELAFLKIEAGALRHYLEGIERRITELEKASAAHASS